MEINKKITFERFKKAALKGYSILLVFLYI